MGYREHNCIIDFLIMQQTNWGLLTTVALNNCYEAMVVYRHMLVYFLLRTEIVHFIWKQFLTKSLKHFWSRFSEVICLGLFFFLLLQLLVCQSQTSKYQSGVEFDFQSICKHHISPWRVKSGLFAFFNLCNIF